MSDSTALGDRMKQYEQVNKAFLPRRTYIVIRVDGKAFHSYLRHAEKPFDSSVMEIMDETAQALCKEVSGTVFAYTQSDEISLLLQDFASVHTEPWFGGNVQKMASVAASTATAAFNWEMFKRGPDVMFQPGKAMFDARVFTIPDPVEVANYFLWRQRDAVRNSISMAAQAHFSHKELQGLNGNQMQEKLWQEKKVNWNDYPGRAKRGGICVKVLKEDEITFTNKKTQEQETVTPIRTVWESMPAPHFDVSPDGFLVSVIPGRSHFPFSW